MGPKNRPPFACSFEIPKKGISEYGMCNMKFKPLLTDSELVMATYTLPFGLSAEPKGRVVSVTKDGEFEKVGDILRFTLEWRGGWTPRLTGWSRRLPPMTACMPTRSSSFLSDLSRVHPWGPSRARWCEQAPSMRFGPWSPFFIIRLSREVNHANA